MEEDFQFLKCKKCMKEAKDPKLLPCLHTFCAECLDESKPIGQCPACKIDIQRHAGAPIQDNLLFAHLQAKLTTFRKIADSKDLVCDRCQSEAAFWCPECEEFLCLVCYNAHQWYLKQKSHEAQKLSDLKNDTALSFLEGTRKSSRFFCSDPAHSDQLVSLYCRGCCKPFCCSCAILDSEHYGAKMYCDIRVEIENRKEDLVRMKELLSEKKKSYEDTCHSIHERLQEMEKVRNETRDQIQAQVKEMMDWIQMKGDQLLEKVDRKLRQDREAVEKKLQSAESVVQRMETSEQLVEKMNSFASDQEVMDLHPFIRESLEDLRRVEAPAVGFRAQTENFADVKSELQVLYKRVKGEEDGVRFAESADLPSAPAVNSEEKTPLRPQGMKMVTPMYTISLAKTLHGFAPSITSPLKRSLNQTEKCIQACAKALKMEDGDVEPGEPSSRYVQEVLRSTPPPPPQSSTPKKEQKEFVNSIEIVENSSPGDADEEPASIMISSSDESEDGFM
ncbi:protein PML isoform X2 [Anolis carolinensis]|uniref:protein PML isoform X2 n=1 Tax=Anolis carolinensis TaxID=28377 RepID=UPI002F2B79C3